MFTKLSFNPYTYVSAVHTSVYIQDSILPVNSVVR
jgi:hypothetical protein